MKQSLEIIIIILEHSITLQLSRMVKQSVEIIIILEHSISLQLSRW